MDKKLKNRSGLLWEIDRILDDLNEINKLPKFLLLENVKNMISKRHIEQYNIWLKKLKKLNYSTRTFKLNAKNYGLPQNRERIYALSILNYDGEIDKETGEILDIDDPKEITNKKTLKDIIKENYKIKKYMEEGLEAQPNRTPSREKMFTLNRKLNEFNKFVYTRTLTTKQDRHPNAGVIDLSKSSIGGDNRIKGKANYRLITTREAYLLMGFNEEDYENVKKLNIIKKAKLYHQAGNSIAVDVMIPLMKLIQELNNNEVKNE